MGKFVQLLLHCAAVVGTVVSECSFKTVFSKDFHISKLCYSCVLSFVRVQAEYEFTEMSARGCYGPYLDHMHRLSGHQFRDPQFLDNECELDVRIFLRIHRLCKLIH